VKYEESKKLNEREKENKLKRKKNQATKEYLINKRRDWEVNRAVRKSKKCVQKIF
jgi:hypothetical protein